MDRNILLIDYSDNFADNFSSFVDAKLIEKKKNVRCFFENNPKKREDFEKKMKYFALQCDYISSSRFNSIASQKHGKFLIKPKQFNLENINQIDSSIVNNLKFENLDFILNYDILDEILSANSIGVYIDKFDIEKNQVDFDFINRAVLRLNKYVKSPLLFIFTNGKIDSSYKFDIPYKILDDLIWQENFYFLSQCKHKIIPDNGSYSFNLWSAVSNDNSFSLKVVSKNKKRKLNQRSWIEI